VAKCLTSASRSLTLVRWDAATAAPLMLVVIRKRMKYDDSYQSCSRTYASLLVYPNEQHPDAITEALGITPSRISVEGPGPLGRQKVNGWFLCTQDIVESKDCRRHIDWLLDQVEHQSSKILELQNSGTRFSISCFWESVSGNGGPTLSPPQMNRLSDLNIEVWWDVWFDSSE